MPYTIPIKGTVWQYIAKTEQPPTGAPCGSEVYSLRFPNLTNREKIGRFSPKDGRTGTNTDRPNDPNAAAIVPEGQSPGGGDKKESNQKVRALSHNRNSYICQ